MKVKLKPIAEQAVVMSSNAYTTARLQCKGALLGLARVAGVALLDRAGLFGKGG